MCACVRLCALVCVRVRACVCLVMCGGHLVCAVATLGELHELWVLLDEAGGDAAGKEGGVGQHVENEGHVGAHAADPALDQRARELVHGIRVPQRVACQLRAPNGNEAEGKEGTGCIGQGTIVREATRAALVARELMRFSCCVHSGGKAVKCRTSPAVSQNTVVPAP